MRGITRQPGTRTPDMNGSPLDREHCAVTASWRSRLRAAHFHDYTAAAFKMWLGIVVAGASVLGWALFALSASTTPVVLQTLVGLLLVAAAAWFPIEIPRSKYSISAADAFIFTMLALLGAPAAILASGCDGLIGAWRSTDRVTSRISTPTAAMTAMAVCAMLFEALSALFEASDGSLAVARLAALVLVSDVPFVLTSLPLLATVTLKRGAWPDLRDWFSNLSWMAAVYLAAALVAGGGHVVARGARPAGPR